MNKTWLGTFKPKTIIYEHGRFGALVVKLVQAQRVGRVRRQLLFKDAVEKGLNSKKALLYFLANANEVPAKPWKVNKK